MISWREISYVLLLLGCISCNRSDDTQPEEEVENNPVSLEFPLHFGSQIYDIPSDNPLTEKGIELGRALFYEKMLSRDYSISCGSCHQQKFAFSDGLATAVGVDGRVVPRNTQALSNMVFHNSFFWDGRAATLEEQALGPIESSLEMDLSLDEMVDRLNASEEYKKKFKIAFDADEISSELVAKAIAQFERTLISANSRYDRYKLGQERFSQLERDGEILFYTHPVAGQLRGGNCGDCHTGILQTDHLFHNTGLDSVMVDEGRFAVSGLDIDRGSFKTISLRNIALTAPYMHDGRFNTLREVLENYNEHVYEVKYLDPLMDGISNDSLEAGEPLRLGLTEYEIEAILAFLETLTDEGFITDERFSDPNVSN